MTRKFLLIFLITTIMLILFFACTENIVDVPLDSTKAITAFNFESPQVVGIIIGNTITVTVPSGTGTTALKASFITTGVSVNIDTIEQINETTPNDFTTPVIYTVVAEDGSKQDYTVTVHVALNSAKAITAFNFENPPLPEIITGSNISVAVNYQMDPTSLIASFTITGVSVKVGTTEQISGATSNDFTDPVVYTVVAEDGSMWDYIVTVNNLARVSTTTISGNLIFSVDLAGTSAKGGGNVLEEGSSSVTERGLCWNTTGFPVITDSHATDGAGIGEFVDVAMTGLVENTVYYVRAYATNRGGTVYGIPKSFNSGYAFGTDFAGGYVFYNNGANGGYVSAKVDQSENEVWIEGGSTQTTLNGNTNGELGTGLANSNAIILQADHTGSAAQICLDYDDGTYSDWFLPSIAGLSIMQINLRWNGFGDFASDYYWSSSETPTSHTDSTAWTRHFDMSDTWFNPKSDSLRVRAIRVF